MPTGKTEKRMRWHGWVLLVLAGLVGTIHDVRAAEHQATPSAREVLVIRCLVCHAPREEDGKLDAIEAQRKSPEGWSMTLSRMVRTHGVELQDGDARILVKYLSDHYGLAPKEVEPYRFILEQRNTRTTQDVPKPLQSGCIQCHSYARIALQRRTQDSWERLPDAKVALMANIGSETASAGQLKDYWFDDAKNSAVPHLIKHQPFETEAWTAWQAVKKPSYAGTWLVVGHDPGRGGDYTGQLTLTAGEDDQYTGQFSYTFADGSRLEGSTKGTIYAGFQWRGVAQAKESGPTGREMRQREIFFASEDGNTISGRRLLTNFGDLGMDETWYRLRDGARLLTVSPAMIQTGSPQKVRIFGMGFSEGVLPANDFSSGGAALAYMAYSSSGDMLSADKFSFGEGVSVSSLQFESDHMIVVEVLAEAEATEGLRTVSIQGMAGTSQVAVYEAVDYIRLTPERGFARPGGIRTPKIFQQYEVVGYANGPDNAKGTDDDVKLGRVGPVTWNLEEYVKRPNDDDIRYVGTVDQTGLFHPNEDGPNPKRHLMEGNVGDVWVEAWYTPEGAKRPMGARAHLLVMPAKFVFPPIE